jgi:hypothetical protein
MSQFEQSPHELDLSLVSGSPLYHWLVKFGFISASVSSVKFKVLAAVVITWLPLVALTWWQGNETGRPMLSAFLANFQESIRFLLILPLLMLAQLQIRPWVTHVVRYFIKSGIVPEEQLTAYARIISHTQNLRDSIWVEVALLILAVGTSAFGIAVMPHRVDNNWRYAAGHVSVAGIWFRFVSMPYFRFFWFCWFWRIGLWWFMLFRISLLKLRLVPTHPDCRGGLGFLASGHNNFAILAFALSCHISAVLGEEILYKGHSLDDLKGTILLSIIVITSLSTLPLLVFTPKLIELKRLGLFQYGILAKQYVDRYQRKWLPNEEENFTEELALASEPDPKAQDHFKAVGNMQVTVFDKNAITTFAIAATIPFAPLLLTVYKFDQLLDQVLKKLL